MKNNLSQSEASFQSLSTIRRSNTEALQYKRQIECNRITNDNQSICPSFQRKYGKNDKDRNAGQRQHSKINKHVIYLRLIVSLNFTKTFSNFFCKIFKITQCQAGGKPSTWFPPGGCRAERV